MSASITPDDVLTLIDDESSVMGAIKTLQANGWTATLVRGGRIEVDGLVVLYREPIIFGAWVAEWIET